MEVYLVSLASYWMIYSLLTLGLVLQFGFVGLINFGHVGFLAIGAYVYALTTKAGVHPGFAVLAASISAAVSAIPIGLITSRLRGDYLAIVTLGFSEVVRLIISGEQWLTNGVQGIAGVKHPFENLSPSLQPVALLVGLVIIVSIALLLCERLVRSPYGRLVQAIRDDEEAACAIGKSPQRPRIEMLVVGAFLAGAAGAAYAAYITFISPEQFTPLFTFFIWIAMLLGGTKWLSGALVGSGALVFVLEGSRFLRDAIPGITEVQMTSARMAIIGLAIVLFTLMRPDGFKSS